MPDDARPRKRTTNSDAKLKREVKTQKRRGWHCSGAVLVSIGGMNAAAGQIACRSVVI